MNSNYTFYVFQVITVALYSFLFCFVIVHLLNFMFKQSRLYKCIKKIPGNDGSVLFYILFVNNFTKLTLSSGVAHILNISCNLYKRHGICRGWIFYKPFVIFFKSETIEALMNNKAARNKPAMYRILESVLGEGLVTSNGSKWRAHRKLINPIFNSSFLEDIVTRFNEIFERMARTLLCEGAQQEYVDITDFSNESFKEAIFGTLLVTKSGNPDLYQRVTNSVITIVDYFVEALTFQSLFGSVLFSWTNRRMKDVAFLRNVARTIIKEKKESLLKGDTSIGKPTNSRKKTFIDLLIECHLQGNTLSEEDVVDEVITFLLGGQESSKTTFDFAVHLIGMHTEVQENIIEEMDSIFGDDSERPVTSDDLHHMVYTECVIKETLRLYPPLPMYGREVENDIKVLDYIVPRGSTAIVYAPMLHQDPDVYPNPTAFIPERFLPENCRGRSPYAFMPFSIGQRNCIGERYAMTSLKTALAVVFRNMRVSSIDKWDACNFSRILLQRNLEPLRIKIRPRSLKSTETKYSEDDT